jgi:hypothetical protein
MSIFSSDLLQAICDWQRGGDAGQKAKRGAKLKSEAGSLPVKFRQCRLCYRQIALGKGAVWQLADNLELPETISAWTESIDVARAFKDGVPPPGIQGAIFLLFPSQESVVINLNRLFRDAMFNEALKKNAKKIHGFYDGIGRYGNSQEEVVLEVTKIRLDDLYELGGFSSTKDEFMELYFGPNPTSNNLSQFERWLDMANVQLGPAWIGKTATDRVIDKIHMVMPALRRIKKLQEINPRA